MACWAPHWKRRGGRDSSLMDGIFGIGPLELILIAILALIVLGPERLPEVMREVAKVMRQLRQVGNELTSQFSNELRTLDEINPRKLINDITDPNRPQPAPRTTASQGPAAVDAAAQGSAESSPHQAPKAENTVDKGAPAEGTVAAQAVPSAQAPATANGAAAITPSAPAPAPSDGSQSADVAEDGGASTNDFPPNVILPPNPVVAPARTVAPPAVKSVESPGASEPSE